MRVRKIVLSSSWIQYYIERFGVYVSEGGLEIICDELEVLPEIVDVIYCEGYLEKELKQAIRLRTRYGITQ